MLTMTDDSLENTSYAWKKIAKDWQEYFTTPAGPRRPKSNSTIFGLKTLRLRRDPKDLF